MRKKKIVSTGAIALSLLAVPVAAHAQPQHERFVISTCSPEWARAPFTHYVVCIDVHGYGTKVESVSAKVQVWKPDGIWASGWDFRGNVEFTGVKHSISSPSFTLHSKWGPALWASTPVIPVSWDVPENSKVCAYLMRNETEAVASECVYVLGPPAWFKAASDLKA